MQMASALGAVRGKWVSTVYMLADLLTKPLDRKRFVDLRNRMMGTSDATRNDAGGGAGGHAPSS